MRPVTITQAAEHYAGTGLTRTAIRRAVISREIPSICIGKKYLLTLESIEEWLRGGTPTRSEGMETGSNIRGIAE